MANYLNNIDFFFEYYNDCKLKIIRKGVNICNWDHDINIQELHMNLILLYLLFKVYILDLLVIFSMFQM